MSKVDSTVRIIVAGVIAALYFTNVINGVFATILVAFSGLFLFTSFASFNLLVHCTAPLFVRSLGRLFYERTQVGSSLSMVSTAGGTGVTGGTDVLQV